MFFTLARVSPGGEEHVYQVFVAFLDGDRERSAVVLVEPIEDDAGLLEQDGDESDVVPVDGGM